MIRIKSDFDRTEFESVNPDKPTPLYTYYYSILNIFKSNYKDHINNQTITIINDDFEFVFLQTNTNKSYRISFKKLLTGTREEVLAVDGIKEYMDICRMHYCCSYFSKSIYEFMQALYCIFPEDIKYKNKGCGEEEYYININGVEEKLSIKYKKKHSTTNKKAIYCYINNKLLMYMQTPEEIISAKETKDVVNIVNGIFDKVCSLLETNIKKNGNNLKFISYEDMDDDIRHQLIDSLNIKTCPYCNRQYITSWGGEKTTAELDHYYQKALFPLFSLSSFNFIPSCHVCNSLMKGGKYKETLYPYAYAADEYIKFEITLKANQKQKNIVDIWLGKGKRSMIDINNIYKLEIVNLCNNEVVKKLINNEIELFRLRELYANHLDQAINVLLIMRIYLEENFYANNINSICKKIGIKTFEKGFSFTKEEIRCFLLGLVNDGQGEVDKPLAKMISDIYYSELKNILKS